MAKRKKQTYRFWLAVALAAILLDTSNGTVLRIGLRHTDVLLFSTLRFLVNTLVTLPFIIGAARRYTRRNVRYASTSGLYMAVAVITLAWAIKDSEASYVSIIGLLGPIIFVVLSARLIGDKVSHRAIAGVTLAAAGAAIIVLLPLAIHQNGKLQIFPLATVLSILSCIALSLATIYSRKANEANLPMPTVLGISSCIVMLISGLGFLAERNPLPSLGTINWWAILYSSIVVALISRMFWVLSYERVGTSTIGALQYLDSFMSVLFPVFILHETLSREMIFGGIIILLGVYITEHHKSLHHKYFHIGRL